MKAIAVVPLPLNVMPNEEGQPAMASPEFQQQVIDLLPRMCIWARDLTHNAVATDDLVQDTVVKTLLASQSFTPGTNFPAWVRRIMYNHFVSGKRRERQIVMLDDVPEAPVAAAQQDQTDVGELGLAYHGLPKQQREAIRSIAIQERSYEEVSVSTGIAIGTLKSRVHRARLHLRAHMEREARVAA